VSRLEVICAACLLRQRGTGVTLLHLYGQDDAGATVALIGLNPELQPLLASFQTEDFQALQEHEPVGFIVCDDVGTAAWSC